MLTNFLCKKKSFNQIKNSEIKENLNTKNSFLWINGKNISHEESEILKEVFDIHPTTIEDISTHQTRIKYEEFENYTLVVLKTIKKLNENSVETSNNSFIFGKNFLITISEDSNEITEELCKNPKKIEHLIKKGENYILHYLLDKEVDKYLKVKTELSEELKKIEREFTENQNREILKKIFSKELLFLELRQLSESTTDLCLNLTKPADNYIKNELIPYFRDVYDHIFKTTEGYKTMLGRMNGIKNMYATITSMKTNEVMRSLTIIMALMMPLTIITGFYGMNVKLPLQNTHLASLYILILMVVSAGAMILISKRKSWIGKD